MIRWIKKFHFSCWFNLKTTIEESAPEEFDSQCKQNSVVICCFLLTVVVQEFHSNCHCEQNSGRKTDDQRISLIYKFLPNYSRMWAENCAHKNSDRKISWSDANRIHHLLKSRFLKKPQDLKQSPTWFHVYLVIVKSIGRLFQIFVAFSERPNFIGR